MEGEDVIGKHGGGMPSVGKQGKGAICLCLLSYNTAFEKENQEEEL